MDSTEALKEKARALYEFMLICEKRPCEYCIQMFTDALASVRAKAVAAERERCAKIAEQVAREWRYHRAIELARAIREPDRQQGE